MKPMLNKQRFILYLWIGLAWFFFWELTIIAQHPETGRLVAMCKGQDDTDDDDDVRFAFRRGDGCKQAADAFQRGNHTAAPGRRSRRLSTDLPISRNVRPQNVARNDHKLDTDQSPSVRGWAN